TDVQAIVAAENAIAHLRGQLVGDHFSAATQFYRQVGDTEPGIDDIGFHDGAGRAGLNTKSTASTQVCGRVILFEIQGRQNLSKEEPGAIFGRHEIGMFPNPAEASLLRPGLFHDRAGIDVGTCGDTWRQGYNLRFELRQLLDHYHMVVLPPSITGYASHSRLLVRTMVRVIVHADRYHRSASGQYQLRVASAGGVARHPGHGAVVAQSEPFRETAEQAMGQRGCGVGRYGRSVFSWRLAVRVYSADA